MKSPQYNFILGHLFPKEADRIKGGKCPFCNTKINPSTDFKDILSLKEFKISGLCQACQDKTFTEDN